MLSCLIAGWACDGSDADAVASSLKQHLDQVAPGGLDEEVRAAMEVEVLSVEQADGEELEVDFRVFDPRHPRAGVDSLRGEIHTAWLSSEGDGYTVRRYGEGLARSVAVMIAAERRQRYEDLIAPLLAARDSSRGAVSDWARPIRNEFMEATEDQREQIRIDLDAGVPTDALQNGLAARWSPPEAREWGVVDRDGRASVLYLRVEDRPEEVCAYRVNLTPPAPPWDWVVQEFVTCQGRGGIYVEEYPPRTILEELPVRTPADSSRQG